MGSQCFILCQTELTKPSLIKSDGNLIQIVMRQTSHAMLKFQDQEMNEVIDKLSPVLAAIIFCYLASQPFPPLQE